MAAAFLVICLRSSAGLETGSFCSRRVSGPASAPEAAAGAQSQRRHPEGQWGRIWLCLQTPRRRIAGNWICRLSYVDGRGLCRLSVAPGPTDGLLIGCPRAFGRGAWSGLAILDQLAMGGGPGLGDPWGS